MPHRSLSECCGDDDEHRSRIHKLWCGAMGFNGNSARIAAVHTSSSFADATPLLGKDGANDTAGKSENLDKRGIEGTKCVDEVSRVSYARIFKSALTFLVAAASLAASIFSFILSPAIVVYFMGGVCSLNFAFVMCNEWRILTSDS